jgi:predicted lipoprotein with Yx(FWY)xxD motif
MNTARSWPPGIGRWQFLLRLAGSALLVATAAIHLDLYVTGFRNIPTIGWLFLLQVIAAFALAAAVLALGGRLVAALGALFGLATLGGYLLSIWVGLFGFREVRTTAGIAAGVIEVAAFAVLALAALAADGGPVSPRWRIGAAGKALTDWLRQGAPRSDWGVSAVSVLALVLLGVAVGGAGGTPTGGSAGTRQVLEVRTINGARVLTNSRGLTLYWFALDKPGRSNCNGSCASYWPPVAGAPAAGPGVTGSLGTIHRADGTVQATYNGLPLYTYIADSAPGQAKGNNLNLSGGVWHEVTVAG